MTDERRNGGVASIPITRTELVWPGKYNQDGTLREVPRVTLPFQVIERVNETRATREARKRPQELSLFDVWEGTEGETFDDGWRNKLIWGDNLLVMSSLLEKFAGKIDLIYIDPPFATGADFSFSAPIGDGGLEVAKTQSIIEEKAYRDTWGRGIDSYLSMMRDRLELMRDLLAADGTLFVHVDRRVSSHLKLILDDIFGVGALLNEIVWCYTGPSSPGMRTFLNKHDVILWYARGNRWTFNVDDVRLPYAESTKRNEGRRTGWTTGNPDLVVELNPLGKFPEDWWRMPVLAPASSERLGFPTQKPEALLERVLLAASHPGDLVADFFCGSGTTVAVAEKLGRRWVGADLGRWPIHVSRKRMLGMADAKPFELLNLGRYERQYWQDVTFGGGKEATERALFEYLAFILRLYGADPVSGMTHLHGRKAKAMVHIASVDAPVTIAEIAEAIEECAQLKQTELHVLGWEWEMGLYELMVAHAKKQGVRLLLLQIPREVMEEQAVDKGDVQFFELAHLDYTVELDERVARLELNDFVLPNTELIPTDVRDKVKKWSDYVDYWAVDWDFREDAFMQGWVAYRTRQDRSLELTSDPHTYEAPGTYTIVVKVIDIFGNDTSQAYEIQVD